jgi:hypothetical protein
VKVTLDAKPGRDTHGLNHPYFRMIAGRCDWSLEFISAGIRRIEPRPSATDCLCPAYNHEQLQLYQGSGSDITCSTLEKANSRHNSNDS